MKHGDIRTADKRCGSFPKPMPVGVSDFCSAVTDYYYVDKTLMIRDFLNTIPKVSLFTRPRRFGKTLNMEMLRVYFEKTEDDTSVYFKDKKIWGCGEKYRKHQGRYPVIFLTFKDVKHYTWEEFLENLSEVLAAEFDRHFVLQNSSKCSRSEKDYYRKIIEKKASEIELSNSLKTLSLMLHKHYGIQEQSVQYLQFFTYGRILKNHGIHRMGSRQRNQQSCHPQ